MKKAVAIIAVLALIVISGAVAAVAISRAVDDDQPASSESSRDADPSAESDDPDPSPPESSVPEPDQPTTPPGLETFYDQELDWSQCEGDFECATLTVPLDYAKPSGETIDLALLKVPSREDSRGAMVVNPGGPGAPGTDYAAAAGNVFRPALLDSFDIVGFDPRGTGESAPVDCVSDDELDAYLAGDPDPETPEQVREFERSLDDFGAGCAEKSGNLINHVSTIEAARDMDVLRQALGEPQLTYFGASYGTKLGATYAELFPANVGRFVLDGAVDVSLDNRGLSLEQAAGFQTALEAYVQNCIDTATTCFLGDTVDEGLQTISDLLDDIEKSPLPAGDRELKVGNAFYGIITPLYVRELWFMLSTALRQALDGDGTALMELADIYAGRDGSGYADNSSEAIFAINCLDEPSAIGFDEVAAEFPAFEEASPTFGDIFAWGLTGCGASKAKTTEKPIEIRGEGAAPILVVGTSRDPATPMKWAEALADQLESGVLLKRDGDGHTAYNSGNECIDTAIEGYLLDGDVPERGTEC